MDGQNRVGRPLQPALVDDFLGAALELGVATLHRIKVQLRRIGPAGHGTGRTAAHADAHTRATQLDQQATRSKGDLVRLAGIDHPQTTGDHDRLVVAALLGLAGCVAGSVFQGEIQRLLVFTEIAQQVRPAKFVVERGPPQRSFQHDLQRTGHVIGLFVHRGQSTLMFGFRCRRIHWTVAPIDF
ncbi:hypothetical protein GALL_493060 [mine drainage metagenome]|uniref:Uncharacterized protein n=1 Tax=mine drainage metagenome TaxID=410659 RepID=A0A1J5PMV1_9ZZZZ